MGRPFTTGEVARIRNTLLSIKGEDTAVGTTAIVLAVPAGNDPDARTVLLSSLDCSQPLIMSDEQKQRQGFADVERDMVMVKTAVPGVAIKNSYRLAINGVDYRIRGFKAFPAVNPLFYRFYLVDEGKAYV